jgi:hypothetical protein
MRALDDLLTFVELPCDEWSRTQKQIYIDWVLASIVAVSQGRDFDETCLVAFARIRQEILERKEVEELSEGGKPIDLKLGASYQGLALSLLNGGLSVRFWSLLEEPESTLADKKSRQWPLVLKNIYVAGAMVMALEERPAKPAIPRATISNITKNVGKFLHNCGRVYSTRSTLYEVWPKMHSVAHYCAALLKMFPPVEGRTLSSKSRLQLAANITEFLRLAEGYEQTVRRLPSLILKNESDMSPD